MENLTLAHERYQDVQARKKALTGKAKRMMESIEKTDTGNYCLGTDEIFIFAEIYNNNLTNASYDLFRYGFLKGQRAMKAALKKKGASR